MKVLFDFNLNAWIKGIEIDADSYEDALAKLHGMSFEELVELGYSKEFKLDDIDGYVIEKTVKIKAYDIEYSIEEEDYDSPDEYTQIVNALPSELVLEIVVEPDDDLEELIADEITYKTNWLVEHFSFMILEEK
jgi:hypothetical protein